MQKQKEEDEQWVWFDVDYYPIILVIAFGYFGWMMLCLGG